MKNYFDITVFISPGTDGSFNVRVASDQGGQGNSTLKLPFTFGELHGVVFGVDQTARDIGSAQVALASAGALTATNTRTATDFGVELFEALFQDDAKVVLVATESMAQHSPDTGVRIRLSMDLQAPGMALVASLPWELMCRKGQRPLVVSPDTPLVRSLDAPRPTDPRPFRAPLRILALMSNPKGSAALNLQGERAGIEQNWARLPGVQVDFVRPVRADIQRQLAAFDYHVVHFMGHGDYDAGAGGTLLLELENGDPDPVTGDEFAMWLATEPLRLVFLNACKTASTGVRSGAHPFAGVATALIRERVPAVVAMQFPISDQAAILFAQTFYERVAQGIPVDAAMAWGRMVLYSSKQPEWATPVLYLRSKDGVLFGSDSDAPVIPAFAFATAPASTAAPAPVAVPGTGAAGALRVFMATPDQDREKLHGQIAKALREMPGVSVIDAPALDDQTHDAAVDSLIRGADLCVHLLGANAGRRLDVDDGQPLRTYPLAQLEIACKIAQSQLVVITGEDKESIGNEKYALRVNELAQLPRNKARFELVITDKNRITEAVRSKLEELQAARLAPTAPSTASGAGRKAFVDSHLSDQACAIDLLAFLEDRNVSTEIRTSSSSSATDFLQLDETVRKSSLYVIVAGSVDANWVKNRKLAVLKSAVKSRVPLLVAKFSANAVVGVDTIDVVSSRFDISALNDCDRSWVDALFVPGAAGKP